MPEPIPSAGSPLGPVRELTRAIAAGDGGALARLYRARFDRLVAQARARTRRDEAFCLDVVQETFLRVIRALPVLVDEPQLDAWLSRTLERCALDALRREQRRRRREASGRPTSPGDPGASFPPPSPPPVSPAGVAERLAALPAATRELLEARFRFGWTLARIGTLLGLAPGAVDGRIGRALDRLREELDDERT